MKNFFKNRLFSKNGLLAVPLLVLMVLMRLYFPKIAPEGFQSFIAAFEFAKTPEQIHILFNGFTATDFRNADIGNYLDFGFMLIYSLFLFQFFKIATKYFGKKWLVAGIPLTIVVLFADISENICLLQITSIYTPEINATELLPLLQMLHIITWIKWGGLAIIFALFSIKLMGKNILSSIESIVFIGPAILSFWAITNDPVGISNFVLSVNLAFFLLILYSFRFKAK